MGAAEHSGRFARRTRPPWAPHPSVPLICCGFALRRSYKVLEEQAFMPLADEGFIGFGVAEDLCSRLICFVPNGRPIWLRNTYAVGVISAVPQTTIPQRSDVDTPASMIRISPVQQVSGH